VGEEAIQLFFHTSAAKPTRKQPRTVGKQSLMLFKKLSSELNSRLKELFRLHFKGEMVLPPLT
jgi:hypothetical protein